MYLMRIQSLPENSILKQTFNEMRKMHNLGFDTWYGRVCELAKQNNLDVDGKYTKREIKLAGSETFKMHLHSKLNDVTHNSYSANIYKFKSWISYGAPPQFGD